jgi:hypothetical protein
LSSNPPVEQTISPPPPTAGDLFRAGKAKGLWHTTIEFERSASEWTGATVNKDTWASGALTQASINWIAQMIAEHGTVEAQESAQITNT